jgi:hypothetical protein
MHNSYRGKSSPIICATSLIFFTKTTQSEQTPNGRKFAQSGHPVAVAWLPDGIFSNEKLQFWGKFWRALQRKDDTIVYRRLVYLKAI